MLCLLFAWNCPIFRQVIWAGLVCLGLRIPWLLLQLPPRRRNWKLLFSLSVEMAFRFWRRINLISTASSLLMLPSRGIAHHIFFWLRHGRLCEAELIHYACFLCFDCFSNFSALWTTRSHACLVDKKQLKKGSFSKEITSKDGGRFNFSPLRRRFSESDFQLLSFGRPVFTRVVSNEGVPVDALLCGCFDFPSHHSVVICLNLLDCSNLRRSFREWWSQGSRFKSPWPFIGPWCVQEHPIGC